MSRARAIARWFAEARNLKRFALVNVWFWLANQIAVNVWYLVQPSAFGVGAAVLYLVNISVAALWLSSLAWWEAVRVEERQIETEESTP